MLSRHIALGCDLVNGVMQDNRDEFPVCFSLEKFTWALSVLWSRCFTVNIDGEEQGALVPLGDMMNSAPTSELSDQQVYANQ